MWAILHAVPEAWLSPCDQLSADHPGSFSSYYPNIDIRYVTLKSNFYMPFFREIVIRLGCIDAESRTISACLGRGTSVLLMVGGAEEAFYARPGSVDLVLKKRKGFVRLALRAGAAIVPMYLFGENELYDQVELPPGSWGRRAQDAFKRFTGVAMPLFKGRGILQYSWGLLPRRVPLVTVMGDPIDLPKIDNVRRPSTPPTWRLLTLHTRSRRRRTSASTTLSTWSSSGSSTSATTPWAASRYAELPRPSRPRRAQRRSAATVTSAAAASTATPMPAPAPASQPTAGGRAGDREATEEAAHR